MKRAKGMRTITLQVPTEVYEEIDWLIRKGWYSSVSDFGREALREQIRRIPWNEQNR